MPRKKDSAIVEKIVLRIKRLREEKGVTLQEFYNDTGIHLARIESEKRDVPISTLIRICDYFEISVVEFFKPIVLDLH